MKRFFSILMLLALLVPLVAFASAPARTHGNDAEKRVPTEAPTAKETPEAFSQPEKKRLSEMDDSELEQFLEEYVPEYKYDSENKEWMLKFLKGHIASFDSDGKTIVPFNLTFYHTWADAIDKGIEKYYAG